MLWTEGTGNTEAQSYLQEPPGLESKLLPYDVLGTLAHVKMLEQQGYLSSEELGELEQELVALYENPGDDLDEYEDVHTFIEEKVTEKTEAGKKIHTGRSRNDQVVTATRLFMKDAAVDVALEVLEVVESLEEFAEEHNELVPGYTHQQQAMPSSTGLWATSYSDALVDDLKLLKGAFEVLDANPLGAAAGYGTALDIDRKMTTDLLGFSQKQHNPVYCVNRGKHELMVLQCLNQAMLDIQKLAEDLVNFSADQQIFEIPEEFCTGSSIMPQKTNPDVLEIARAKSAEVSSHQYAVQTVISKLPHGYNRDTQQTKKHLVEAFKTTLETLEVIDAVVSGLEVSDEFEVEEGIYAADAANQEVEDGLPFREAYQKAKQQREYRVDQDAKQPASEDHSAQKDFWQKQEDKFEEVKQQLLGS